MLSSVSKFCIPTHKTLVGEADTSGKRASKVHAGIPNADWN